MSAADRIRGALSGLTGSLPRRAVARPDGSVDDRVHCPAAPEVVALSVACEILRADAGEAVYSRHTPSLLAQCLGTNDPGAWRALLDDAATGDLDAGAMAAFWSAAAHLDGLVGCLAATTTGTHMWLVIRAMHQVVVAVDAPCVVLLGRAFERRFSDVVAAVSRRAPDVSADMRAEAITVLGKLMVWCDIPVPSLGAMLGAALAGPVDDVLRLFTFAPIAALTLDDPTLVDRVLARAERAPQAGKYASAALLVSVPREQLAPLAGRVLALVQRMLDTAAAQGALDCQLALVCGALARLASPPRTLATTLAHALTCVALAGP